MTQLPPLSDLSRLSHAEKDALIIALWTRVNEGLARVEELGTRGVTTILPFAQIYAKGGHQLLARGEAGPVVTRCYHAEGPVRVHGGDEESW